MSELGKGLRVVSRDRLGLSSTKFKNQYLANQKAQADQSVHCTVVRDSKLRFKTYCSPGLLADID